MNMSFEENVYGLINKLGEFSYTIESADPVWEVIFPHKTSRYEVYHYMRVTKYRDTFYIGLIDGKLCSLEIRMNKSVQEPKLLVPHMGLMTLQEGGTVLSLPP